MNDCSEKRIIPPARMLLAAAVCALASFLSAAAGLGFLAIAACGVGAFLYMYSRSPLFCQITPAAYGIGAVVFSLNTFSAVCIVAGFAMTVCLAKGGSKTKTVLVTSLFLLIQLSVLLAVTLYIGYGSVSVKSFLEMYNGITAPLKADISELAKTLPTVEGAAALTENQVTALFERTALVLPAYAVCLCNIIAYFAVDAYQLCAVILGRRDITGENFKLELGAVSAIMLFVSYMASLIFGMAGVTAVSAAADNLFLILLPPFALLGVKLIIKKFKSTDSGKRWIYIILLAVLVFVNIVYAAVFVAFFSAVDIIITEFIKKSGKGGMDT